MILFNQLVKLFLLIVICFSCNEKQENTKINELLLKTIDSVDNRPDFFYKVPSDEKGNPDKIFTRISKSYRLLDTLKITDGFEDLCFRISSDFDGTGRIQYYLLKLIGNKWVGNAIVYEKVPNTTPEQFRRITTVVEPRTGWTNFINKLMSLNIFSIPPMNELKDFDLQVSESLLNSFEVATKKSYRFAYYYDESILKGTKNPFCKNTIEIVELLKKEMIPK